MATYKEINGQKVQSLSSDPPAPYTGQIWYNSTSNSLKYFAGTASVAWATGANIPSRRIYMGGCGPTTSALIVGGSNPSATPISPNEKYRETLAYNGTAWTAQANYPFYIDRINAAGDSTAAIAFGGVADPSGPGGVVANSYNFNGSSWTSKPSLNAGQYAMAAAGTATSALSFGGEPDVDRTDSWNGSSWTNQANMPRGGKNVSGTGPSNTAALAMGGQDPSPENSFNTTLSWNGSWTAGPNMNVAREGAGAGGTTTSALIFGGRTVPSPAPSPSSTSITTTESYNGSWTNVNALVTAARFGAGGGASNASAFQVGGRINVSPDYGQQTQEWGTINGTKIVTTS